MELVLSSLLPAAFKHAAPKHAGTSMHVTKRVATHKCKPKAFSWAAPRSPSHTPAHALPSATCHVHFHVHPVVSNVISQPCQDDQPHGSVLYICMLVDRNRHAKSLHFCKLRHMHALFVYACIVCNLHMHEESKGFSHVIVHGELIFF